MTERLIDKVKQEVEFALADPPKILAWFKTKPKGEVIGVRRCPSGCPIHTYLDCVVGPMAKDGMVSFSIRPYSVYIFVQFEDTATFWFSDEAHQILQYFIAGVDEPQDPNEEPGYVTAGECVELLERLIQREKESSPG